VVYDETGGLTADLPRYGDWIEPIRADDLAEVVSRVREGPVDAVLLNAHPSEGVLDRIGGTSVAAGATPVVTCFVPPPADRAIASGAVGHLTKPVSREDLRNAILGVGNPVRRILVVDDDPDVLQLFTRMLRVIDQGLAVETASSGQEAIDRLERGTFDLVLLDVVMPDVDGWQVLAAIAGKDDLRDLPVLFVSARDPADRPPETRWMLVTVDGGLSAVKLLRFSLELSRLLLVPDARLDPVPQRSGAAARAYGGTPWPRAPAPASPLSRLSTL
jgi:CheY-like chemotaxis protein